ncbi:uncharacterized protein LOC122252715 [Penaeus japonicus]|uniref:uncharacterized protein LOC122252715 n=1 Tax=Penaeus japonicus TaxID=27405 RepID=UPI001C710F03|nr:uncharacterized protein LOC122252715 [Penaeus japonicus]
MLRRSLLSLLALHIASACQEVIVTRKTRLPISEAADHVEALVGVRPRQGDWGVVFEVEREHRVIASFSISHNENKRENTTTYVDILTITCGENSPLKVASPWPADWLLGEVKFLLFNISKDLLTVHRKVESSRFENVISEPCLRTDPSNVSFSASRLPLLPTPTLSIGCTDEEPRNSTKTESGDQSEGNTDPTGLIAGLCVLFAASAVVVAGVAWRRRRSYGRRFPGGGAVRLSTLPMDEESLPGAPNPDEFPSVRQRPPIPSPRTVFPGRRQFRLSSSGSTSSSVFPLLSSSPPSRFDSLNLSFSAWLPAASSEGSLGPRHCAPERGDEEKEEEMEEMVSMRHRSSEEERHTYERITFMRESLFD